MSDNYGLFYDQWRTTCPSCKCEKLIVVSVCLAEAGQEHNPSAEPECFAEKQELDAEHFQGIWRTSAPELVASLTRALNAVKLVDKLRHVLYWDCNKRCWDPDKKTDADTLAAIDECFEEFDAKPAP